MAVTNKFKKKVAASKTKSLRKVEYQTQRAVKAVLTGLMVVIDPSSGSSSSMPGYAIFKEGKLIDSGVMQIDHRKEVPRRLQDISKCLSSEFPEADVLVIEDIPSRSFGRNAIAHATLLKSVGCILASSKYHRFIEISPSVWHAYIKREPKEAEGYVKGDEWDAKIMGYCILELAREIQKESK